MSEFPIARQKDLIIEEVADEMLVYDLDTDRAHFLDRMSALIWKHCDGENSAGDIAELLASELNSPVAVEVVTVGLAELARHDLLEHQATEIPTPKVSRRRLIQNLGLSAAISLPLIMSITAPTAAQQGSQCQSRPFPIGCFCVVNADCASFNCNGAGVCAPPP